MAIDINGNCVVFNGEALCSTPAGAEYAGVICHQGFCDTRILQGTVSGYVSGGGGPSDVIEKFPFTSDAGGSDVGELSQARYSLSGQSSQVSGYSSGGNCAQPTSFTTIDKFPFSSDSPAVDVADLTQGRRDSAGQSSLDFGYASGGTVNPAPPLGLIVDTVDKFPFSSDSNATDVGELTRIISSAGAGQSSFENGYTSGGETPPDMTDTIDKFPFATDTPATDVGEMTRAGRLQAGQSSATSGYNSGGNSPPVSTIVPSVDTIDKFPFATDTPVTDVGELTIDRASTSGQSSSVNGYTSGGTAFRFPFQGGNVGLDTIDKFPFSSDTNATDVAELIGTRSSMTGQQV